MFSHIVRVKGFFDDEPKAKKLYFHLSRREMFDFIKRYDNVTNFQEWMQSAIDAEDLYTLMEFFDDLIGTSYGERQGEHFVKTPQIKESFLNSPEYEKLFDLFMENPGLVKQFYEGILPEKLLKQVKEDGKFAEVEEKIKEADLNSL